MADDVMDDVAGDRLQRRQSHDAGATTAAQTTVPVERAEHTTTPQDSHADLAVRDSVVDDHPRDASPTIPRSAEHTRPADAAASAGDGDLPETTRQHIEDENSPAGGAPRRPRARVKLYHLNSEGVWDDCGTGHVEVFEADPTSSAPFPREAARVDMNNLRARRATDSGGDSLPRSPCGDENRSQVRRHEDSEKTDASCAGLVQNSPADIGGNGPPRDLAAVSLMSFLRVFAETDGKLVLCAPVRHASETFYQLQGTIISWPEPQPASESHANTAPTEMALSFAEAAGCRDVYDRILRAQSNLCAPDQVPGRGHDMPQVAGVLCSVASQRRRELGAQHYDQERLEESGELTDNTADSAADNIAERSHDISSGRVRNTRGGSSSDRLEWGSALPDGCRRSNHHVTAGRSVADPHLATLSAGGSFFDETDLGPGPVAAWTSADPMDDAAFGHDIGVAGALGSASTSAFLSSQHQLSQQQPQQSGQHHQQQNHAQQISHISAAHHDAAAAAAFTMPAPDRAGLEALAGIFSDNGPIHIPAIRERVVAEVAAGNYVSRLCDVFEQAEDLMDVEALRLLYHIFRSLFVLATNSVIEILVNDSHILSVIGALEYDPDVFPPRPSLYADQGLHRSRRVASPAVLDGVEDHELKRSRPSGFDHEDSTRREATSWNSAEDSASSLDCMENSDACPSPSSSSSSTSSSPSPCSPPPIQPTEEPDVENIMLKESKSSSLQCEEMPSASLTLDMAEPSFRGTVAKRFRKTEKSSDTSADAESDLMMDVLAQASVDVSLRRIVLRKHLGSSRAMESQRLSYSNGPPPRDDSPEGVRTRQEDRSTLVVDDTNDGKTSEETSSSVGPTECSVIRRHRDFLMRDAEFRSVVNIPDESIIGKIHLNYKVTYIKDVIIPRVLDEGALASLLFFNNVDIVMYFVTDREPFEELFERFHDCMKTHRELGLLPSSNAGKAPRNDGGMRLAASSGNAFGKNGDGEVVVSGASDLELRTKTRQVRFDESRVGEGRSLSSGRKTRESIDSSGGETEAHSDVATDGNTVTDEGDCSGSHNALDPKRRLDEAPKHGRYLAEEDTKFGTTSGANACRNRSEKMCTEELHALLGFLNELCVLAKAQQPLVRNKFHTVLRDLGVLEVALEMLKHKDEAIRLLGSDILSAAVVQDPCDIRLHMLRNLEAGNECRNEVDSGASQIREYGAMRQFDAGKVVSPASAQRTNHSSLPSLRSRPTITEDDGSSAPGLSDSGNISVAFVPSQNGVTGVSVKSYSSIGQDISSRDVTNQHGVAGHRGNDNDLRAPSGLMSVHKESDMLGDAQSPSKSEHAASTTRKEAPTAVRADTRLSNDMFPLLGAMMDVLCNDLDSGVFLQVLELLRSLLDVQTMRSTVEKENFLDVFYERFVVQLLPPLRLLPDDDVRRLSVAVDPAKERRPSKPIDCNTGYLCDLMSFCALNHSFRMKYFVLGHDVASKVLKLLYHQRAHVRLSALRFLRACVGARDDFYDRYFVKNQLLRPVFEIFRANQHRDNLINSAVLELVSFLATKRRVLLLEDIMQNHTEVLSESLAYSSAFADARKAHSEIKSNLGNPGVPAAAPSTGVGFLVRDVNGTNDTGGHILVSAAPEIGDVGMEDVVAHDIIPLEASGNRQGSHFIGDEEMRHAPDQDEDEAYFAADDDVGDDGISELSRILEGDRALLPPQSSNSFMSSDVHLSSSSGVQVSSSSSDISKPKIRGDLDSSRRLSPETPASETGSLSGAKGLEASAEAEEGPSPSRAPSGNALVSSYSMTGDEDNSMEFEEAMASSAWASRDTGRNRGSLVDYPFDCEAGDMFGTTNDTVALTTGERSQSPFGPGRGAITLKWEYGDFKESIRVSPKSGSGLGNGCGKPDGDDGNAIFANGHVVADDSEDIESRGRRADGEASGCDEQDGEGRHDPVSSADSGDVTTSPKKRRRTNDGPSSRAKIGLETSTRWLLSGGGQRKRESCVGDEDVSNSTKERCLQDAEGGGGVEDGYRLGSVSADSGRLRTGHSPLRAVNRHRSRSSDSDDDGT